MLCRWSIFPVLRGQTGTVILAVCHCCTIQLADDVLSLSKTHHEYMSFTKVAKYGEECNFATAI